MAFDNPLRQNVLSGLDDPETEFGAGFDIGMKTSATPSVDLEAERKKVENEAKSRKKSARGRALEAIASALAVYTSKDPGKAAQQMIEMRMQMVEREKARMFQEQQLNKELSAREKGLEYQRETGLGEIEARAAAELKQAERGWEAERDRLEFADQISDENRTEEDRLTEYNKARGRVFEWLPDTDPTLANKYAACVTAGGGEGCDTAEVENLRTQLAAKHQAKVESDRSTAKASIMNANSNARRVRLQEIQFIQEDLATPMTRPDGKGGEIPILDENGVPVMKPGSYQDAERIWYQRNGLPVPGTAEAQADPVSQAESAKEVVITAGNAIKAGDNESIGDFVDNYNKTGQTDNVFEVLFTELDVPTAEVLKVAKDRGINEAAVFEAKGAAIGKQLAEDGIGRGREGDAAIKRMIAMDPDIPNNYANVVLYHAQNAQQGLGSYIYDATVGKLVSGVEERINAGD